MTEIITGRAVLYVRQLSNQPNQMIDPTMTYVDNVREHVNQIYKQCLKQHDQCPMEFEWLDEYTCKVTLPKGWTWSG